MVPVADTSANSRRTLAFIIVVAVHVLMIWGFNAGLTDIIVEKVLGPMTTDIIEEKVEVEDKPPPPPPKLETPPPFVPPPDFVVDAPPAENTTAIQTITTQQPVAAPPPAPVAKAAVIVAPRQNPRRPLGSSDEYYPPAAKRAGEEGSVDVQMIVTEDGRILDPKVIRSSGFPRLDEGALKYVRTWRLLPGTSDGKPVQMSHSVRVTFQLKEAK
jgi:protein TonB